MVEGLVKVGMLLIIGVYLFNDMMFFIGMVMNKNLIICMGNCNYWCYLFKFVELVCMGVIDLVMVLLVCELMVVVFDVYCVFDMCELGWMKVKFDL